MICRQTYVYPSNDTHIMSTTPSRCLEKEIDDCTGTDVPTSARATHIRGVNHTLTCSHDRGTTHLRVHMTGKQHTRQVDDTHSGVTPRVQWKEIPHSTGKQHTRDDFRENSMNPRRALQALFQPCSCSVPALLELFFN